MHPLGVLRELNNKFHVLRTTAVYRGLTTIYHLSMCVPYFVFVVFLSHVPIAFLSQHCAGGAMPKNEQRWQMYSTQTATNTKRSAGVVGAHVYSLRVFSYVFTLACELLGVCKTGQKQPGHNRRMSKSVWALANTAQHSDQLDLPD